MRPVIEALFGSTCIVVAGLIAGWPTMTTALLVLGLAFIVDGRAEA